MKNNKAALTLILILIILTIFSCSKIPPEKIFKKPENKIPETKKQKPLKKDFLNTLIVNTTENTALEATLFAIKWVKWKIFSENYDNGIILLKEAYVYSDNGKLKRIYHWPPKELLSQSNISGYLKKVAIPDSKISFRNVAFTQENMKIVLSETNDNQIKITIDHFIFPYMKNLELGDQLQSSYYIEEIIFTKIKEYLSSN